GVAASTLTVVTAVALSCRSSKAVARTEIGPAPASAVSRVAWLRLAESLPPFETKAIDSGRLSGLVASQLIPAVSPTRTVAGEAVQEILGGFMAAVSVVAAGCGEVTEAGSTG